MGEGSAWHTPVYRLVSHPAGDRPVARQVAVDAPAGRHVRRAVGTGHAAGTAAGCAHDRAGVAGGADPVPPGSRRADGRRQVRAHASQRRDGLAHAGVWRSAAAPAQPARVAAVRVRRRGAAVRWHHGLSGQRLAVLGERGAGRLAGHRGAGAVPAVRDRAARLHAGLDGGVRTRPSGAPAAGQFHRAAAGHRLVRVTQHRRPRCATASRPVSSGLRISRHRGPGLGRGGRQHGPCRPLRPLPQCGRTPAGAHLHARWTDGSADAQQHGPPARRTQRGRAALGQPLHRPGPLPVRERSPGLRAG